MSTGHVPNRLAPTRPYLVRRRRWRAYVTCTGLTVVLVASGVGEVVVPDSRPVWALHALNVVLVTWLATLQSVEVRRVPRIDAAGLWLWVPATMQQVLVPWDRTLDVRAGRGRLLVHVSDPEGFALGDARIAAGIRRTMRSTGGAAFACEIDTSPRRLRELDAAVRSSSGGRHAVGPR
jgi:hypothetical protein